jgi:hypothetical protein
MDNNSVVPFSTYCPKVAAYLFVFLEYKAKTRDSCNISPVGKKNAERECVGRKK